MTTFQKLEIGCVTVIVLILLMFAVFMTCGCSPVSTIAPTATPLPATATQRAVNIRATQTAAAAPSVSDLTAAAIIGRGHADATRIALTNAPST